MTGMTGRYIRQKRDGPRDPTMTYVEDVSVFRYADVVRDFQGWSVITAIDEEVFGNPEVCFIHLQRLPNDRIAAYDEFLPTPHARDLRLHDLRSYDVENTGLERAEHEALLREHMTGFVQ